MRKNLVKFLQSCESLKDLAKCYNICAEKEGINEPYFAQLAGVKGYKSGELRTLCYLLEDAGEALTDLLEGIKKNHAALIDLTNDREEREEWDELYGSQKLAKIEEYKKNDWTIPYYMKKWQEENE